MHKYKANKAWNKLLEAKKSAFSRNVHVILACRETLSCHLVIENGREI